MTGRCRHTAEPYRETAVSFIGRSLPASKTMFLIWIHVFFFPAGHMASVLGFLSEIHLNWACCPAVTWHYTVLCSSTKLHFSLKCFWELVFSWQKSSSYCNSLYCTETFTRESLLYISSFIATENELEFLYSQEKIWSIQFPYNAFLFFHFF